MSEQEMEQFLLNTLHTANEDDEIRSMRTFEEMGIMTRNQGLVVRMDDGSEFQITIVKSR